MSRVDVLLWAKRVCARRAEAPHVMLDIPLDATLEDAQFAFHDIARMAHPDLHRTTCSGDELELVTTAFALVASAYQQFRASRVATTKMASIRDLPAEAMPPPKASPAPAVPEARSNKTTATGPQMNARAAVHYRKATLSLRAGDLAGGVLHLKLAIASDPQSKFLRNALTQLEAELAKKP